MFWTCLFWIREVGRIPCWENLYPTSFWKFYLLWRKTNDPTFERGRQKEYALQKNAALNSADQKLLCHKILLTLHKTIYKARSPLPIPSKNCLSAVQLFTDGLVFGDILTKKQIKQKKGLGNLPSPFLLRYCNYRALSVQITARISALI